MSASRPTPRWLALALALTLAACGLLAAGGCTRRATGSARRTGTGDGLAPAASGPLAPLRSAREDLSDASGRKIHVRLVVPADASRVRIDDLIRRVATHERPDDGSLWISVFLDGMDVNSVAYAFGIARPGQEIAITYRESLQTYR